jgi:hypothetical protein
LRRTRKTARSWAAGSQQTGAKGLEEDDEEALLSHVMPTFDANMNLAKRMAASMAVI